MNDKLPEVKNLINGALPGAKWAPEHFEPLLTGGPFRLERIISHGHTTPPDQWYDQPHDEWVLLAAGKASIEIEEKGFIHLAAGDYVLLPAGMRHRVTYTSAEVPCVWLALHLTK